MKIYGSCKPVDGFPADALIDEFVGNDKASKMENFWKIVDEFPRQRSGFRHLKIIYSNEQ